MEPSDLTAVAALAAELEHAPRWEAPAYQTALARAQSNHGFALVAEADAQAEGPRIAGFLIAGAIPPEVELESIAVRSEFQRRGVARRLFAELLRKATALQCVEVLLEVRPSNRNAVALYRSLGFTETGRRKGYYRDPVEDAVMLRFTSPLGADWA